MKLLNKSRFSFSEKIKRFFWNFEDLFFDKMHGIRTDGVIFPENLHIENKNSLKHSNSYQAIWCRTLRELFFQVRLLSESPCTFVDVGCGKGKACFYAEKKKFFKSVVGFDFSQDLIDIANINNLRFKNSEIKFTCADAIEFNLPSTKNLVFIFNSFDEVVMTSFIKNNVEHFQKYKSIIAYANDVHKDVLISLGFVIFYRNEIRKLSLYQIK
ncbi:MAG: class I SAM-dependent methyltransferase [Gammaproteobacteria bacterium]|nr:class I SAM-dependent methyltransferase [Gammaproteobacteria bacterium]